MNFNYGKIYRPKKLSDLTLRELEEKVYEITEKQNYITHCGLSEETTELVIKELQEQKKDILDAMHEKIDTL